MLQTLAMLIERDEKYLLQILKIDKFGNYIVADPLNEEVDSLARDLCLLPRNADCYS